MILFNYELLRCSVHLHVGCREISLHFPNIGSSATSTMTLFTLMNLAIIFETTYFFIYILF